MVYRELLEYVNETRGQGYSDEQIRETLRKRGWTSRDIQECFETLAQERFKPLPPEESKTREEKQEEMQQAEERAAFIARGYSVFEAWVSCMLKPGEALPKAKYFASYRKAAAGLATPFILAAIAAGSGVLLFPQQVAQQLPENVYSLLVGMGTALVVGVTLAGLVLSVLQYLAATAVAWLLARLLGGRASFKQHLFLASIAFGSTFLLGLAGTAILLVTSLLPSSAAPPLYVQGYFVPVFVVVGLAIWLLLLLYGLWLHVQAAKAAHEFSTLKALVAIAVSLALFSAINVVAGILANAGLLGGAGA